MKKILLPLLLGIITTSNASQTKENSIEKLRAEVDTAKEFFDKEEAKYGPDNFGTIGAGMLYYELRFNLTTALLQGTLSAEERYKYTSEKEEAANNYRAVRKKHDAIIILSLPWIASVLAADSKK